MAIQHLFVNDSEDWTEMGKMYNTRIKSVLRPIIMDAKAKGYSLRDMQYVIMHSSEDIIMDAIFEKSGK